MRKSRYIKQNNIISKLMKIDNMLIPNLINNNYTNVFDNIVREKHKYEFVSNGAVNIMLSTIYDVISNKNEKVLNLYLRINEKRIESFATYSLSDKELLDKFKNHEMQFDIGDYICYVVYNKNRLHLLDDLIKLYHLKVKPIHDIDYLEETYIDNEIENFLTDKDNQLLTVNDDGTITMGKEILSGLLRNPALYDNVIYHYVNHFDILYYENNNLKLEKQKQVEKIKILESTIKELKNLKIENSNLKHDIKKIKNQEEEITLLKNKINKLEKTLIKKNNQIEYLNNILDDMDKEVINDESELLELQTDMENEIKQQDEDLFINKKDLTGKHIYIVGGKWFSFKLQELEKFCETRNITFEFIDVRKIKQSRKKIKNGEFVIIDTSFIDHPSYYGIKNNISRDKLLFIPKSNVYNLEKIIK